MIHTNDSREWCKTSGYYADPQLWQETYDYRPGLTPTEPNDAMEFPSGGLPDIFSLLGKAARDILDAISFYLNLRSSPFTEILDNVPLRSREISSSVLSVCCYARPSFQRAQPHNLTDREDGQMVMYSDHEHQLDKSLISLVKSDKAGLHVEIFMVAGFLWMETLVLKKPLFTLDLPCTRQLQAISTLRCTEQRLITCRGTSLGAVLWLLNLCRGSVKAIMRRKNNSRCKPLPPSKRLRLEAQRVLKERVQEIADKKGIKLRFCNLKECENHIHTLDSPCANIRMEIGWPPGVPFVHPHDLPNKAKIGFLEAYESGWITTHGMELSLTEVDKEVNIQPIVPVLSASQKACAGVASGDKVLPTSNFLDLSTVHLRISVACLRSLQILRAHCMTGSNTDRLFIGLAMPVPCIMSSV
ncbi:hypothetical protein GH714_001409 [Hevea brasiliensis]|uniref:Uncharacterized protein n=1 Tax=Hevea brasiliensis TaxID=3981 RepID=A0A6A6M6H1_HEVBR|nr:hypothetical protein GH714_001409 [Hevea brasiliensis]